MLERWSKEASRNILETVQLLIKQQALSLMALDEQGVMVVPLSKGDYTEYTSFQVFTAIHCICYSATAIHCNLATVFAANMETPTIPDTACLPEF